MARNNLCNFFIYFNLTQTLFNIGGLYIYIRYYNLSTYIERNKEIWYSVISPKNSIVNKIMGFNKS